MAIRRRAAVVSFLTVVLTSLVAAQDRDAEQTEKRLIAQLKRVPVSVLGVRSKQNVDQWVAALLGRGVKWEANDCGEGGDGLAAPTCVEISSEDPHLFLWIAVADTEGKTGKPVLFYGSIQLPTGEKDIARLSELPELVRTAKRRR